jgi:hypothetical protein
MRRSFVQEEAVVQSTAARKLSFVQEEAKVESRSALKAEESTTCNGMCPCQLAALAMAPPDGNHPEAPTEPSWGSLDQESYSELRDVMGDLREQQS